jgi:uncharacterized cupin superfamily protein
MPTSFDPSQTYARLNADSAIALLPGGEAFWSQPEARIEEAFSTGWLVCESSCDADWSHWEMHSGGDELVYLLSGSAAMLVEADGIVSEIPMGGRGAVVVPRGAWHTARVFAPSRMLFITPGAGTRHRPAAS